MVVKLKKNIKKEKIKKPTPKNTNPMVILTLTKLKEYYLKE